MSSVDFSEILDKGRSWNLGGLFCHPAITENIIKWTLCQDLCQLDKTRSTPRRLEGQDHHWQMSTTLQAQLKV